MRKGRRWIESVNLLTCARWIGWALGILSVILAATLPTAAEEKPSPPSAATQASSKFRGDDDWPDLSGFLDERYGFVPLVIPITEPAVGYGAAGVLAFIDKPLGEAQAGFGRPDITAVGGLWKRLSLVGFVGAGGAGFRYEVARKYGLHMGVDVAFGPGTTAIYVQFGSAWARP